MHMLMNKSCAFEGDNMADSYENECSQIETNPQDRNVESEEESLLTNY